MWRLSNSSLQPKTSESGAVGRKQRMFSSSATSSQWVHFFPYLPHCHQPRLALPVRVGLAELPEAHFPGRNTCSTPPALLYINKRAFAGCTQLCKLVRMGKKGTWRSTCAEHDAFEMCTELALPTWIRFLPKPNPAKEEWADFMRSCAEANLSAAARRQQCMQKCLGNGTPRVAWLIGSVLASRSARSLRSVTPNANFASATE